MELDLKDLLEKHQIDPRSVLVLRHTPPKGCDRNVLQWLAAHHPTAFNAYQQTQEEKVEKRMKKAEYIASFIGHAPGCALFVGFYERHGQESRSADQIRSEPSFKRLESERFPAETKPRLVFDLRLREDLWEEWKGKLTIKWPGKEINWHRFSDEATFKITAIHAESLLSEKAPENYRQWNLHWNRLQSLPESWKAKLRGWCGIYFIFDVSDGKGYIGKASGSQNLLGRWLNYAERGDGGNVKLRGRDPANFRFSILELIPGDLDDESVEERERNWMLRLRTQTRVHGLNLPEVD